jgi:hypothetical protein
VELGPVAQQQTQGVAIAEPPIPQPGGKAADPYSRQL